MYSLTEDPIQEFIFKSDDGFYYAKFNDFLFNGVYQPIYDKKLKIIGFEGLVRIKKENGDQVFIEEYFRNMKTDIDTLLTNFLICTKIHLQNFSIFYNPSDLIFINVHPIVFNYLVKSPSAIQKLLKRLDDLAIPCSNLVYEITEDYNPNTIETSLGIAILSEYGIKTALDDFGSSFCDMERVKNNNTEFIKIDRSIIQNKRNHKVLINDLLAYRDNADVFILAEGIETDKQLNDSMKLGFDFFQGYYLSMPLTANRWLELHSV